MDELRDLEKLRETATSNIRQYSGHDFILPSVFKEQVKILSTGAIFYDKYSAVIVNSYSKLKIYLPNQWFYIASYFTDLYNELLKYKSYALQCISKERLHDGVAELSQDDRAAIDSLDLSQESKSHLERFIIDGDWWGGGKSIDRNDFYVSPILNAAELVNATQTYVADLCAFLSDKKDLVDLIIKAEEEQNQSKNNLNHSLQQISYGAPGTGKSHCVRCETKEWEKVRRVVRTTFHPDSDYSTFVGAYKPTTENMQRYDIYNKPITKDGVPVMEQVITYDFVPQAFLQAYVDAWKNRKQPEYLIIEEINRGNCAQIFGDLFQLLDRGDDGYSEYTIRADKDLQRYLSKEFADAEIEDYPNVKSGVELLLPNNLYIRATMNTSDQSLFPIDSAFKRRWDWHYVPIAKGNDNGVELNWMIDVDGDKYDWWTFVEKINAHVFETTNSEDKQLGFFFCKAKENIISAKSFVSKVVFYLWNDVFKDFGFDNPIFSDKNDVENPKLSFDKFHFPDGRIRTENVSKFLTNLGLSPVEFHNELIEEENDDFEKDGMNTDDNANSSSKRDYSRFCINGEGRFQKREIAGEVMKRYINDNPNLSADEIAANWGKLGNVVARLVQTEADYNDYVQSSKEGEAVQRRFIELALNNGDKIYVSNQFNPGRVERLSIGIEQLGWPYKIERITE